MMISFADFPLVETEWLALHLDDQHLCIVDARWRRDGSGKALYESGHIPNAVHLDYQLDLSYTKQGVPYMLIPPDQFAQLMSAAGIGAETTVVAYAETDHSGAARLWWALRFYGHRQVVLLNGGITKWQAEKRPLTTDKKPPQLTQFNPRPQPRWLATAAEIEAVLAATGGETCLVDTRPPEQFAGKAVWTPDGSLYLPPGQHWLEVDGCSLRGGRLPGAINLHATKNQNPRSWVYLHPEELKRRFVAAGVDGQKRIITYCGVGISAANGLFALYLAGCRNLALYDGSWSEWGADASRQIERDEAAQ